jgi:hypothetical protein
VTFLGRSAKLDIKEVVPFKRYYSREPFPCSVTEGIYVFVPVHQAVITIFKIDNERDFVLALLDHHGYFDDDFRKIIVLVTARHNIEFPSIYRLVFCHRHAFSFVVLVQLFRLIDAFSLPSRHCGNSTLFASASLSGVIAHQFIDHVNRHARHLSNISAESEQAITVVPRPTIEVVWVPLIQPITTIVVDDPSTLQIDVVNDLLPSVDYRSNSGFSAEDNAKPRTLKHFIKQR